MDNLSTAGKAEVAELSAPSNEYIEMVLDANNNLINDHIYTAPFDGYLSLSGSSSGTYAIYSLVDNYHTPLVDSDVLLGTLANYDVTLRLRKGQKFQINRSSTLKRAHFIKSNGGI